MISDIVKAWLAVGSASSFFFLIASSGGMFGEPSHFQKIGGDDLQQLSFGMVLTSCVAWPLCWAVYIYHWLRSL